MQLTESTPKQREDAERALRAWSKDCELFKHCCRLRMRLPERGWRYVEPAYGSINGLPHSRGRLLATNGILCAIEQSDERIYVGHIDWFVADQRASDSTAVRSERSSKRMSRIKKEYV